MSLYYCLPFLSTQNFQTNSSQFETKEESNTPFQSSFTTHNFLIPYSICTFSKNMKGTDMLCASQAAPSISHTMEEHSSSSSSSDILFTGGRAIDRHNPIIRDSRRINTTTPHSPITTHKKNKYHKKVLLKENYSEIKKSESSVNINPVHEKEKDGVGIKGSNTVSKNWNCTMPGGISPPGSTRYLLGDDNKVLFNAASDFDRNVKLFAEENSEPRKVVESFDGKLSAVSVSPDQPQPQVVVLKVSLHCRGCEKKMSKHISRMEGVTSFNIDFKAKKVTVTGNVTPLGVLSSISKVKNAQLWSPTISSVNLDGSGMVKNE